MSTREEQAEAITPPAERDVSPSWRLAAAYCALMGLSFRRQARAHQTLWIALLLLACAIGLVRLQTMSVGWNKSNWRMGRGGATWEQVLAMSSLQAEVLAAQNPVATALSHATLWSERVALERTGSGVFAEVMVYGLFLSFLLPVWSLSFATQALGSEREGRTLLWLVTRPLPRPAIYLALFLAALPWTLALNLGGFVGLCLAAGEAGRPALRLFWPAILAASCAFTALFHLLAACSRRPAVLAILYCFFLETILGNMPGYMKRVSISFYTRCLMFDAASDTGLQLVKPSIYLSVNGTTAAWVLGSVTVILILLGMIVFARTEYLADV